MDLGHKNFKGGSAGHSYHMLASDSNIEAISDFILRYPGLNPYDNNENGMYCFFATYLPKLGNTVCTVKFLRPEALNVFIKSVSRRFTFARASCKAHTETLKEVWIWEDEATKPFLFRIKKVLDISV